MTFRLAATKTEAQTLWRALVRGIETDCPGDANIVSGQSVSRAGSEKITGSCWFWGAHRFGCEVIIRIAALLVARIATGLAHRIAGVCRAGRSAGREERRTIWRKPRVRRDPRFRGSPAVSAGIRLYKDRLDTSDGQHE